MKDQEKVRCGGCDGVLLGEAIKVATNLHYHIHCFLCSTCGCELLNSGFFTKLAKYYCAEDYHALFGTLCSLCSKYIEGEGLSVQGKGKSYHLSCLTCSKCGRGFDEGSRITFEKDETLCDECRKKRSTLHVCAGCHDTIIGTSIYAMEQEWHMDCFTCGECKRSLSGEYMYKDGIPYCEEDYQNLYGQSCNICSEYIIGKVLQAGGNSYHTSCLKCYICTQPFEEGQEIFMQEEIFWHTDCDDGATNDPGHIQDTTEAPDTTLTEDKKPPELVLPPPPSTTPPPQTPKQDKHRRAANKLNVNHDMSKSSASIGSDYEELIIPPEPGKSLITEADFDDKTVSSATTDDKTVSSATSKSTSSITNKSQSSFKSDRSESVQSARPRSVGSTRSGRAESIKSREMSLSSNSEVQNEMYEIKSLDCSSTNEMKPTNDVFMDISEPLIIYEDRDDNSMESSSHETSGKQSDTSVSDKENNESYNKTVNEEPIIEEQQLSVKEILRLAQEKERLVLGNAVLPRKQDLIHSKKYLSTDSEGSDHERTRSSDSNCAPLKPPRKKSPVRDPTVSVCQESPNSTIRGLRQVDSPILKLLNDLDNKDKDDEIDYLPTQETYDINILQKEKFRLPKEIDRSQLQRYLSPDQFETAFKMNMSKFDSLPMWKKTNLKKAAMLF